MLIKVLAGLVIDDYEQSIHAMKMGKHGMDGA
jgi:hypothetical protein